MSEELGDIRRVGDAIEVTLARTLSHRDEDVWAMLTDPEKLPLWLAPGMIELRPGGAAKLNFTDSGTVIDSVVSAFEEGELLEYSWSTPGEPLRPVRWALAPLDMATDLRLTITTPAGEDAARAVAGWEAHLEMLEAALEGVPIKFPFARFKEMREAYKAALQ